jgi:hypothetical protein
MGMYRISDVEKAFEDWLKSEKMAIYHTTEQTYCAFARFFAERLECGNYNGKPLDISGDIDMPKFEPIDIDALGEPINFIISANGLCSDDDLPDITYTPSKGRFPHGTKIKINNPKED